MQAVGAPLMQPYQQLQAAPIQQQVSLPVPVPQPCKKFISYMYIYFHMKTLCAIL
jgi:hypothetical protein